MEIGGVDSVRAEELLNQAKGSAKIAIVMAKRNVGYEEAIKLLKENGDLLRKVIES